MSKYGFNLVYLQALERVVAFCKACHEYIDDKNECSNPWCPEEQE